MDHEQSANMETAAAAAPATVATGISPRRAARPAQQQLQAMAAAGQPMAAAEPGRLDPDVKVRGGVSDH